MVKKLWRYVKPFSSDTGTSQTDRQTDRQIYYINTARQCADARYKPKLKEHKLSYRKQIARQLRTQFVDGNYRSDYAWPWNLGQGHSRSLKLVPFESLAAVSYSPSIVTMTVSVAVSELFSVKACDLGNWVRSRSMSLKMAPFDGPYAYWLAIVYIALSCTIFELFDVEYWKSLFTT